MKRAELIKSTTAVESVAAGWPFEDEESQKARDKFVASYQRLLSYERVSKEMSVVQNYHYRLRDQLIPKTSFVVLSRELITALVGVLHNRRVVEIGSGSGFLAKQLEKYGVPVTAIDHGESRYSLSPFKIHKRDLDQDVRNRYWLFNRFDTFLMTWPDCGSDLAYRISQRMKAGQSLVYQGEGWGGCTADDNFFRYISNRKKWKEDKEAAQTINQWNLQWPGLHDRWSVYIKR
jgi:SAM-dependent methyltransferase